MAIKTIRSSRPRAPRLLSDLDSLHPRSLKAHATLKMLVKLAINGAKAEDLFMLKAHLLGCWAPLLAHGRDHVDAFLRCDQRPILALGITEPGAGSDVYSASTTAKECRGSWRINGIKTFVTNAPFATHFLIFAQVSDRTEDHRNRKQSLTCFLVPANTRGASVKSMPPLIGLTSAHIGEIRLKSVEVQKEAVVGLPGQGAAVFRTAMLWERSLMFSDIPIHLKRLLHEVEAGAQKKHRQGTPLSEKKEFRDVLTKARQSIREIQLTTQTAAAALDGTGNPMRESLRAKLTGARLYEEISRALLQAGGSRAYISGSPLEINYRNSLLGSIYSGPNELLAILYKAIE